ncbi:MAG: hypothetical protein NC409_12645 [Clostridium sp.]|nr:hypothetical protein [Clostridium sp.]
MSILREDFRDEILSERMNGRRRFQTIQNDDGTVSFEDVTELAQVGDDYGQKEINQLNKEVNHSVKKDELIRSLAITEDGMVMDGKTCSENLVKALGTTLTETLAAGKTTLTFTSAAITDDSLIDVYVDVFGVCPSAVSQEGNTLTLTFDAQSVDVCVKVKVM